MSGGERITRAALGAWQDEKNDGSSIKFTGIALLDFLLPGRLGAACC